MRYCLLVLALTSFACVGTSTNLYRASVRGGADVAVTVYLDSLEAHADLQQDVYDTAVSLRAFIDTGELDSLPLDEAVAKLSAKIPPGVYAVFQIVWASARKHSVTVPDTKPIIFLRDALTGIIIGSSEYRGEL